MMPPASYDLITGEPPPITQAGVVSLYTREFFALARSRLRPNGLISYWLPIRQAAPDVVLSLVRGFVDVFPESVLLAGSGAELILLGRVGAAPQLDPERVRERLAALPGVARDLDSVFLRRPQELFGMFVASADTMREATRASAPLVDDRPSLEYGDASRSRHFSLPVTLFDLSDAAAWCPACLAPRSGPPDDAAESYAVHIELMQRLYAHPHFLTSRGGGPVELRAPEGELAEAEVERSLFLRSLLGRAGEEHRRARQLIRSGQLAEGTRALEDVVRLAPGNADARAELGQAYWRAGRSAEGCRELEQALAIAPAEVSRPALLARCRAQRAGPEPTASAVR
jgi:hypothetical protein